MEKIDFDTVVRLRKERAKWTVICDYFTVSKMTMVRWREKHFPDSEDPQTVTCTPAELDDHVKNIVLLHPNRGEKITMGYLNSSNGIFVRRQQLRDSILRVDPEGRLDRRSIKHKRGVYHSEGLNHTWHCDGNHKLVKSKMVIHGCIDGFSRKIMYLCATDNNLSKTVADLFIGASISHGVPYRIRQDYGSENVKVGAYMYRQTGDRPSSISLGSSVNNDRIERLWREVNLKVTLTYKEYFKSLTNRGFSFDNPAHRYVIHHLFLPLINEELTDFISAHNSQACRTLGGNISPNLCYELNLNTNKATAHNPVLELDNNDEGIDNHGVPGVNLQPTTCPLPGEVKVQYEQNINPITLLDMKPLFLLGNRNYIHQVIVDYWDNRVNAAYTEYTNIYNMYTNHILHA